LLSQEQTGCLVIGKAGEAVTGEFTKDTHFQVDLTGAAEKARLSGLPDT
jgi:hypothetical protein